MKNTTATTSKPSKANSDRTEFAEYIEREEEAAIAAGDVGRLTHLFLVRAENAGKNIRDKGFQETLRKVAEYRIREELVFQLKNYLSNTGWDTLDGEAGSYHHQFRAVRCGSTHMTVFAEPWESPTDVFIDYKVMRTCSVCGSCCDVEMVASTYVSGVEDLAAFLETVEAEVA